MITVKEEFLGSVKTKRAVRIGGWQVIALWLALKGYVSSSNSGGFIPEEAIDDLEGIPKQWQKAMRALVECGKQQPDGSRGDGLVERITYGYLLHDYEDHGTPVEVEEDRRRRLRAAKQRRYRDRRNAEGNAEGNAEVTLKRNGESNGESNAPPHASGAPPHASGARALPSPAQPSPAIERDPPTPNRPRTRDPMARPELRSDVLELLEAWKSAIGQPGFKLRAPFSADATILAEAIDHHSLKTCLIVAEECPNDGMVSGKTDEKRVPHKSIAYIFGNESTFQRIFEAAKRRSGADQRQRSAIDAVAEASRL